MPIHIPISLNHDGPDSSYPPTPSTPNSSTPYFSRPSRAIASFDNLVALANYHERIKALGGRPISMRRIVWRDRGQPVVELGTVQECVRHAVIGGLRSGTMALSIRSTLNLVLALLRLRSRKSQRIRMILESLLTIDTMRFSAMMFTFVAVYKFILNALPLMLPMVNFKPKHGIVRVLDGKASESEEDDEDEEEGVSVRRLRRDAEDASHSGITFVASRPPRRKVPGAITPMTPMNPPEGHARLSLSAHTQLILIRKRTRRWHALMAGFISGFVAILLESPSRRNLISQQMFVRGLQSSYSELALKRGWKIKNGEVIVFGLACGQIMWAFLMKSDTLPMSYNVWIANASKVPREGVRLNYTMVREGTVDGPALDVIINRKDVCQGSLEQLQSLKALVEMENSPYPHQIGQPTPFVGQSDGLQYVPLYAPCACIHPHFPPSPIFSSHFKMLVERFYKVALWMLPIYGGLHFIPSLLFKRGIWLRALKAFVKNPLKEKELLRLLARTVIGTLRSCSFLGAFVAIYQGLNCGFHILHEYLSTVLLLPTVSQSSSISSPWFGSILSNILHSLRISQSTLDKLLISPLTFFIPGMMTAFALFIEEKRRRPELAMYVLPKALESLWLVFAGKVRTRRSLLIPQDLKLLNKSVRRQSVGKHLLEGIFGGAAMGMLMSTYQNNPQHLSGLVRRILYQFVGPN